MEISHEMFGKIVEICYEKKVPIDIKGKTGIGKSQVIKQKAKEIAKKKNKEFVEWNEVRDKGKLLENISKYFLFGDLRLSQMDPTDLKGLVNFKDNYVEWVPNILWLILSHPEADGIVFFDEANLAPPSVLAAMYQVINDRQSGELPISKNILLISAGNTLDDKAHVHDEPAPLKNRRINYVLKEPFMDAQSKEDWGKWAANNNIDSSIISFLYFKPSYLHKFDKNSTEASFPTPRAWVKCSELIQGVDNKEILYGLISGSVGEGVAAEYQSFLKVTQKIDFRELLKNPKTVEKYNQLDMKFAVVSGVSELFKNDNKILGQAVSLCHYMDPDFGMYMMRIIKGYYKGDFPTLLRESIKELKNEKEVFDRMYKYLS